MKNGGKIMKANYHTHTWRCRHAEPNERAYVERAIEGGLQILGFADHTPYPFPPEKRSGFRIQMNEMDDYVDTVLALKKEYEKDIEIHLGLETEYYPKYFEQLMEFLKGYPVEYLLLAQHFIGNEGDADARGSSWETTDENWLVRYCNQVTTAMETGHFTYLAHPDMFHFVGNESVYDKHIRQLCRNANRCHMPLEINLLGLFEGRHYPNEAFWKIAGEEGCKAILGSDAHLAKAVWRPETIEKGKLLAKKYGLELLETVELKNPMN